MQTDQVQSLLSDIEKIVRNLQQDVVANAGFTTVSHKADGSEQTPMDVRVENEVFQELASQYPSITFCGEESGYTLPLAEYCLLFDPIDGTKSYIEGVEGYTAMAVVIVRNEAVGSLIYRYTDDTSFVAIRGQGAYKNGKKLSLKDTLLPEMAYCRERMIPFVRELPELSAIEIEKGPTGAGYGFSLVAEAKIAARINAPHSIGEGGFIHDYAPGVLLVQEAGGAVIPFNGQPYSIDNFSFVACHPALAQTMKQLTPTLKRIEIDSLQK